MKLQEEDDGLFLDREQMTSAQIRCDGCGEMVPLVHMVSAVERVRAGSDFTWIPDDAEDTEEPVSLPKRGDELAIVHGLATHCPKCRRSRGWMVRLFRR